MSRFAELLGESPSIVAVRERVAQVVGHRARSGRLAPILLLGETGTGKGLLARAIHREGSRSEGPFVDVNCAAIPETLLESELFGFERGAFTDARAAKPGLFQAANHGMIFLDEVNSLSEPLQAKLLKVLEERAVRRLGGTRAEPVDVLIVAAANADLEAAVRNGRFRSDLYYRLAVLTVRLPPLRERKEDVLLLAQRFLARACMDYGLSPRRLSEASRAALVAHDWPGNVRELANVIERVALASHDPVIEPRMLELPGHSTAGARDPATSQEHTSFPAGIRARVADVERQELLRTLQGANWNVTRAAAALGITRNTLRYRLEKHALSRTTTPLSPGAKPRRAARSGPTFRPSASLSTPGRALGDAGPRWERRLVALLQAVVAAPEPDDSEIKRRGPIEILVEKVRSFGGRVEELGAAGVLAVFGAEGVEDAPSRAALAAMALCKALERRDHGGGARPSAGIRVAIHVGHVMIGHVGSEARIDREAKRSAGAFLEALVEQAEDGAIVVSEATAAFLQRRFQLAVLEALLPHWGQAYRILGREPGGFGVVGWLSPFVGRESELGTLHDLLSRTDGRAQVVGIVGEAGMGKSRLLYEFRRSLEGGEVGWLEARCASYTADVPYSVLAPLLSQACGILETDDPAVVDGKLREHLARLGMNHEEDCEHLRWLIAGERNATRRVYPDQRRRRAQMFEVVRRVLLNTARLQTTVVVLEDAHWTDATSEDCFLSLLTSLGGARLLFITTYRPEHRPPWMDRPVAIELTLPPLAHADCLTVFRSVVSGRPMSDSVARAVLAKAGGNPFFLEELASDLQRRHGPSWHPGEVPASIQQVIQARIDHLDDASRQLIQTASVLGPKFSPDLLEAIWDGQSLPSRGLQTLVSEGFLLERHEASEPRYVFRHALIQEVAYANIPAPRRQALHLAAGRSLERRYPGRLDAILDGLAYHYSRSGDAQKAVEHLTRFAEKSARAYALPEAVTALLDALQHVERLPAGAARDGLFKQLVMRQTDALHSLGGRPRESLDVLLRQRPEVERLQDPVVTAAFYLWLGWMSMPTGEYALAISSADRAFHEAERCGNGVIAGKASAVLGHASYYLGRPREGVAHGHEAVRRLEGSTERWWLGLAWYVIGLNAHHLGEFALALDAAVHLDAIAADLENPRFRFGALWIKGLSHAMEGKWDTGIAACQTALEMAPRPLDAALASFFLALAHLEKGDSAQAIALLEPILPQFERFPQQSPLGLCAAVLAEAYLRSGNPGHAREWALEGLRLCRLAGQRAPAGFAQRVLGRVAQERGDFAEAERSVGEALQTFTDTETRFEQARTHLVCAGVAEARARHESAAEHLREALGLFEALRLPYWAERARDALGKAEGRHAVP